MATAEDPGLASRLNHERRLDALKTSARLVAAHGIPEMIERARQELKKKVFNHEMTYEESLEIEEMLRTPTSHNTEPVYKFKFP